MEEGKHLQEWNVGPEMSRGIYILDRVTKDDRNMTW